MLTEDLIEEQQEILARFGSTPEAAQSRAELQSLSVKLGMTMRVCVYVCVLCLRSWRVCVFSHHLCTHMHDYRRGSYESCVFYLVSEL